MEPGAPFDLNAQVARWRHLAAHALSRDALDELEVHLWDVMAACLAHGATEQEAFREATHRLGAIDRLADEFRKVGLPPRKQRRPFWQHHPWVPFMLINYVKIVLRTLRRHKGYAFISIAGLAAQALAEALSGMAFCQLVNPGAPFIFGTFATSMSMATGAPTFETPDG